MRSRIAAKSQTNCDLSYHNGVYLTGDATYLARVTHRQSDAKDEIVPRSVTGTLRPSLAGGNRASVSFYIIIPPW